MKTPWSTPWPYGLRTIANAALALGLVASAAAQTAPANRVYVSSEKDHKVHVFDGKGERVGSIDVCQRPRHMMFNASRSQLYVCCGDSNQLGIVDLVQGRMVRTVALGASPEIFDLSPDGKTAYVSIEDENVMAAYDLDKGNKLFEVKTGGEPEGILVMPDGKTAYVTSEVANVVHLIDLQNRKLLKNIKVGNRPRRFALAADGKELWVSNELGASVTVLSTADQKLLGTVEFKVPGMRASDITPVGLAPSADGRTVWVGLGRANHVAFVDAATRKQTELVLVGKRAWNVALNAAEVQHTSAMDAAPSLMSAASCCFFSRPSETTRSPSSSPSTPSLMSLKFLPSAARPK